MTLEAATSCRVYVLNPHWPAVIYRSMKKTDKEDALKPVHILEDMKEERLPTAPAPGAGETETGMRVPADTGGRNRALNWLHVLFLSRGITTAAKKNPAGADRV